MQEIQTKPGKPRYALFDALRGATMVSMVLYHFCYDLFVVEGLLPDWPFLPAAHIWQQSICCTFILLAGFCWQWGQKHNLRRGLLLNACGLLITGITWLIMPQQIILFGVLNFIGCAILLTIPAHSLLRHIPPVLGTVLALLLFAATKQASQGTVGLFSLQIRVPAGLYTPLLTPVGFPAAGFWSSDFFPLVPWLFLFWAGYFLNRIFAGQAQPQKWAQTEIPALSRLGRYSLIVYMLHQPVCFALAWTMAHIL